MKNKKLLSDIKEYLKYYENQVLEDWYELIRHISVSETGEGIETFYDQEMPLQQNGRNWNSSDKVFCKTRSGPGREVWQ